MKKILVLLLTVGLLVTLSAGVWAAVKVTVGGEGNFGYDFAKDDYKGDDGANFGDLAVTVKAEVDDNITLFGKIKNDNFSEGRYFTDEAHATIKIDPVSFKIGYYGFGFGGNKDILDVPMGDLKSHVGIQAEATLAEGLVGKVYLPTKGTKVISDTEAGAFGFRLDYSQELFGLGFIYGQSDWKQKTDRKYDSATAYTLTAFFKPVTDLKAYVDYSTLTADLSNGKDLENTNIIIGALYSPADLPIELRLEYDLDDENEVANPAWKDFNPWGVRFAYKINSNVKIEANRNKKAKGSEESAIKLNICF